VKHARNVLIILALAAAVVAVPGSRLVADMLVWALFMAFLGTLAWFLARTYSEFRASLFALDDRMRGILYGSIAVAVLAVTATPKLWDSPAGTLAWFLLVGGASFGVYSAFRAHREY